MYMRASGVLRVIALKRRSHELLAQRCRVVRRFPGCFAKPRSSRSNQTGMGAGMGAHRRGSQERRSGHCLPHPGLLRRVFADFNKHYPGIKLVSVTGRGSDLSSRIMAERRADKYLADIYMGSTGTPFDIFYPAKVLEPFQSILILPEVREPSNWFRKQHHYGDPEGKFIFVFEGVVRSDMAYNSKLLDPKEFSSYWDLLKPKWKGKIVAMDPKLPGFPTGLIQFAYYSPDLGAQFLRQLFGEMDVTLARDGRQIVDWLAVGKFALGLAAPANEVFSAMKQGLPLGRFEPRTFKEGIYMRATQGSLSVLTRNH